MKNKFYAVKCGRTPGIYTDWESCKAQVDSFSGAEYKSFSSKIEAEKWLGLNISAASDIPDSTDIPDVEPGCAVAYVDGSYKQSAGKFSYGIVLFVNDGSGKVSEQHFNKAFTNPELLEMRNVSGEIMGAAQAMKSAREMGLKKITIYHDYEGIAKWCLGLWKTNKPWVIKYKAFYDDISQYIKVDFIKVKGHSNDRYNDLADELAKAALEGKNRFIKNATDTSAL